MGIRAHYQLDTLIQVATDDELLREAELAVLEKNSVIADPDDLLKTVVSKDCDTDIDAQDNFETNSTSSNCSLEVQPSESSSASSLPFSAHGGHFWPLSSLRQSSFRTNAIPTALGQNCQGFFLGKFGWEKCLLQCQLRAP